VFLVSKILEIISIFPKKENYCGQIQPLQADLSPRRGLKLLSVYSAIIDIVYFRSSIAFVKDLPFNPKICIISREKNY